MIENSVLEASLQDGILFSNQTDYTHPILGSNLLTGKTLPKEVEMPSWSMKQALGLVFFCIFVCIV